MRYMLMVKSTGYSEAGIKHSQEYHEARMAYQEALARAGALLAVEELEPSASGLRISYPLHGGEPEFVAGPFAAHQGLVAEYTLIEVKTEDEAAEWARRMPIPTGRGAFEIEMRRLEEQPEGTRDLGSWALEADLENQLRLLQAVNRQP